MAYALRGVGVNAYGELALGDTTQRDYFTDLGLEVTWLAHNNSDNTFAAIAAGKLYIWGAWNSADTPTQHGTDSDWATVDVGYDHFVATKTSGSLWAMGGGAAGALGQGDYADHYSAFVRIGTDSDWLDARAGRYFTVARKSNNTLWSTGAGGNGQTGLGGTSNVNVLTQIGTGANWIALSVGDAFCHAIKATGSLWGWGYGGGGVIGDGATSNRLAPVQIGTDTDWVEVADGANHVLARKSGGSAWSWGDASLGQTGQGDETERHSPTQIGAATDWLALGAGAYRSMAARSGGAYFWGQLHAGQFGEAVLDHYNTPALVSGLDTPSVFSITGENILVGISTVPPTLFATPSVPLAVRVFRRAAPSVALRVKVFSLVAPSVPLRVRVFDPTPPTAIVPFHARVNLGGVLVTAQLTGPITIEAEASVARVATFSLRPSGSFTPASWLNQRVEIDYVTGDFAWRLFTGVVDKPSLDFTRRAVSFRCTDDLPRRMDQATRKQIDALTPTAKWSRFAFDPDRQGWDYLQDRLSTLRASLCLTAYGELRLFGWGLGAIARIFTAADTLYQTPVLTTAPASQLVNYIHIEVQARRPNLYQADASWSWVYDGLLGVGDRPYFAPSYEVIQDALSSLPNGWTNGGLALEQVPGEPGYALSASGLMRVRWVQDQTDVYVLSVDSPESVARYGVIQENQAYAMQIAYDETAWVDEGTIRIEDNPDIDPIEETDLYLETRLAQAARRIADTHRAHRLDFSCHLDPRLELGQAIRVETDTREINGQIWKLVQTIDTEAGSARSAITLAVSYTGGSPSASDGLIAPDPKPDRDELPDYIVPPLSTQVVVVPASYIDLPALPDWSLPGWNAELWNTITAASPSTYSGMTLDAEGRPQYFGTVDESLQIVTGTFSALRRAEFLIPTPAIEAQFTDPVERRLSAGYHIAVPNDDMLITL